ncbi:Protein of unknown function [Bacillus sp. 491mf]|uniref:DUF1648 domain-containing protein n=2 Tax=Bacillus TaxID=1386 RepID=UPI0008F19A64|nr:DUF1648 domain-containing protein [Bacillus sp. 491mf]SFC57394.1 Protein of unknown function [Bacillus sp. 491mf]
MLNMLDRPKIKIPKTKSEWIWDIIGFLFYIGSIIFLISVWNQLPEKVPTHFNGLGEVDRMDSKWQLLILPGIGLFIILLMKILEKHPESHNYPERFNESNARQFYLISRKIINQLKNICLIIFSFIVFESAFIGLGWGSGFGKWFLPLTISGLGIPIVLGIIKQRKIL